MGSFLPDEQVEGRRQSGIQTDAAEALLDDLRNSRLAVERRQAFSPEVTVYGKPGESHALPGNSSLDIVKSGKLGETSMVLGYTDPHIKMKGPHETVTVAPDGTISTNSVLNGKFIIKKDGDRQIVHCPSGNEVVIQNGRIVEATTGGKKTEFLTPKEAAAREAERQAARERSIDEQVKKLAGKMADAIVGGNIPINELNKAFTDAQWGFYGKDGAMKLARAMNSELKSQGSDTRIAVYQDKDTGGIEVRVRSPQGVTSIPIENPNIFRNLDRHGYKNLRPAS